MKGYFYVTTNNLNGKVYYGSGSKKTYLGSGIALRDAITKYGKENFTMTVLREFETRDTAFAFEDRFLKLYKVSSLHNTYNLKDSAEGGNTLKNKSNEEKIAINKKRSDANKLYYETHKRETVSDETRKKQSDAKIGKTTGPRDISVKEKIKNTMMGASYSIERKEKMKAANKLRPLVTCPHCGLEGKKHRNMTIYHFDNCKKNMRTESVLRGDIAAQAMDPECASCEG